MPGGAGGFFPIGGGGPFILAEDIGLCVLFPAVFRRFAIEGEKAGRLGALCPGLGGAAMGGRGAAMAGGFGAELRDDSGSDVYEESRFAEYKFSQHFAPFRCVAYLLCRHHRRASSISACPRQKVPPVAVVAPSQELLRYFDRCYSVLYSQVLEAQDLREASALPEQMGHRLMVMVLILLKLTLLLAPIDRL